jgi:putative ABC transport system permease protein
MILEHLKTGFRHLVKDKFYTLLNFAGLCTGIVIALFIATWVIEESGYDKHFTDSEKIFRIERDFNYNGMAREMPVTSFNYAEALVNTYPEIETATKLYPSEIYIQNKNQVFHKNKVYFADSNFFRIFDFNLIAGNPGKLLHDQNSVVLTRKSAVKLFGNENVLGKTLLVRIENLQYALKVTGIIDHIPDNTHFHPEIIISLPLLKEYLVRVYHEWRVNVGYTYIKLKDAGQAELLQSQFPEFLLKYVDPAYRTMLQDNDDITDAIELKLKNIEDIHLTSHLEYELENNGDLKNLFLLSGVAILTLFLAVINYVNLTNARSEMRSLETGMRKVFGSHKLQLALHYFIESFVMILLAFLFSIVLLFLLSPLYQNISGKAFHWMFFDSPVYFAILLATFIFISLLAGIYPAIFISRFKILKSLKGKKQVQHKKFDTKVYLVIFQFFISIGLITFALLMTMQVKLIRSKDIGFNPNNLLYIEVDHPKVREEYNSLKNELEKISQVEHVTSAGTVPINQIYPSLTVRKQNANEDLFFAYIGVNYDYFKTMNIELLAGRYFSNEFSDTSEIRYIINERATKLLGYQNPEEAIGQLIETKSHLVSEYNKGEIVGVVKDFHIKSLHNKIEPVGIQMFPEYLNAIFVRIQPENMNKTIQKIQTIWQTRYPECEFNYSFLSDIIREQYQSEKAFQVKLILSTILAVMIGCMGLLGLSIYILQQRTKEIGVRKVNGASSRSLVVMFAKQYLRWITISALFACPISYFFFKNWLNNFAVKIDFNYFWIVFMLAWLLISLISLLTVIGQTIKYANLNPVDVLKYE